MQVTFACMLCKKHMHQLLTLPAIVLHTLISVLCQYFLNGRHSSSHIYQHESFCQYAVTLIWQTAAFWVDCTLLLQQNAAHLNVAPENLDQPTLAQQASALHDAAHQNMAESVESPEASGAGMSTYNPSPTGMPHQSLSPHSEEAGPSPFVSPKKQKTEAGHAVNIPATTCIQKAGASLVGSALLVLCAVDGKSHTVLAVRTGAA